VTTVLLLESQVSALEDGKISRGNGEPEVLGSLSVSSINSGVSWYKGKLDSIPLANLNH
jgi:hypothetical protein